MNNSIWVYIWPAIDSGCKLIPGLFHPAQTPSTCVPGIRQSGPLPPASRLASLPLAASFCSLINNGDLLALRGVCTPCTWTPRASAGSQTRESPPTQLTQLAPPRLPQHPAQKRRAFWPDQDSINTKKKSM